MSSVENFMSENNVELLMDVIKDNEVIKLCASNTKINITDLIYKNLKGFYENESINTKNLTDLNKKYIMLITNYMTSTVTKPVVNKTNTEPITHEDIQKQNADKFTNELNLKQQEFTNYMNVAVPPTPNFKDEIDKPLSEMDEMIKEITEQRKYDIDKINYNGDNTNWITSKKTSIKEEKKNNIHYLNDNKEVLKYITIHDDNIDENKLNIIDLTQPNKKSISWSDKSINQPVPKKEPASKNDFFNKLKIVNDDENTIAELKNRISVLEKQVALLLQTGSAI